MGFAEEVGRGDPGKQGPCPSWEDDLCFLLWVLQPLEGDLCYANLTPQQPGTSSEKKASKKPPSFAQASQEEVEYVTMVSIWWGCVLRTRPAIALL